MDVLEVMLTGAILMYKGLASFLKALTSGHQVMLSSFL